MQIAINLGGTPIVSSRKLKGKNLLDCEDCIFNCLIPIANICML
jgi:hypothetical protein